jgi:hypothetical protein
MGTNIIIHSFCPEIHQDAIVDEGCGLTKMIVDKLSVIKSPFSFRTSGEGLSLQMTFSKYPAKIIKFLYGIRKEPIT